MAIVEESVNTHKWPITPHVAQLESSIIREILKISSQPGVISFAGGLPAPELFPLDDLRQAMADSVRKYKDACVQYSLSKGIVPLRELIAERATARGSATEVDNLIVTCGGQQAIELLGAAFISPGDYIITENPTYVGALQAFNIHQARYAPVEMDEEGMIVDLVEENIRKFSPKLIYTVANFQNPTGITMSRARREALIDVANRYDIPIVDDDPYGDIRFAGEPQPTMKSIGGDTVITVGTFSKVIAPGLRIGWVNGPGDFIPHVEKIKQCMDLHTNTLCQYMIYEFIKAGKLEPHIEKIKVDYRAKRDAMLETMRETFPTGVKWTEPEGGLFLWVELPKHMSAKDLLPKAVERKVAYVYGQPFHPDNRGANTLRLNFSNANLENIRKGTASLGKLISENM